MRYVIAVFLDTPAAPWIDELRRTYDPLAGEVPAHLTLVHPISCDLAVEEIRAHMVAAAHEVPPFELELRGVTGHEDEYLFLNVKRGNDDVIFLRDGLLRREPFAAGLDPSVTYLPHVTVGRVGNRERFRDALAVARQYGESLVVPVNEIHAYRIDAVNSREVVASVPLGGPS